MLEKTYDGYKVYHRHKGQKLYVKSFYRGTYQFCTDYTHAKHYKLETAKLHDVKTQKILKRGI